VKVISKLWRRWNLGRAYRGDVAAMNRLYRIKDPWRLDFATEKVRFEGTLRLIQEGIAPHFESILEIGCGEGLQTETLGRIADRIVGVDASSRAVARARQRGIPNASFRVDDFTKMNDLMPASFGLVTACEILYYIDDVASACRCMTNLADTCLATYYQGAFQRLDVFFADKDVEVETIMGADCSWRVVYWRNDNCRML